MLANFIKTIKTSTVYKKLEAVLVFCFRSCYQFLHKKFMFGLFSKIDEKFFKFLIVGAINTLFAYSIYALFVAIGLKANLALFFQYIIGVLWNFKTTGAIVFKNNNNKLLFKFILSYIFTFIINSACLALLTRYINDYLAQALLVLPVAILSFIIFKFWVFKD